MFNIKRISVIALVLLIVGIIGSILTFKSVYQSEEITKQETIDSEGIENIHIISNNIRTEVLPTNDSEITAELLMKNNKYQLSTEVEGDTLSIQVKNKQRKFVNLNIFTFGSKLTVYVPKKVYESLAIEADNGRISVDQVQADHVDVKTDNGKVELANIESTTFTVGASNGLIEMRDISSSTIKVNASNGKITLNQVEGEIFGRANNGNIELITQDLDRFIELETDNGKINVQTEQEPTNVTFDIRVDNGKMSVFGEKDWDTVIGKGENVVKLKTNNGSITVTK